MKGDNNALDYKPQLGQEECAQVGLELAAASGWTGASNGGAKEEICAKTVPSTAKIELLKKFPNPTNYSD